MLKMLNHPSLKFIWCI